MNLHQHELTVEADGKTLCITIQNCEPIREKHFKNHIEVLKHIINKTDGYSVTEHIGAKKRNAKCHEAIVDA